MDSSVQLTGSHFNLSFAMQIMDLLMLKEAANGKNYLFSPLSLHSVLSLIAVGSTQSIQKQVLCFLGSKSIEDLQAISQIVAEPVAVEDAQDLHKSPLLSWVNSIWVDKRFSLKPSFKETARMMYKAQAKEVDFANKAGEATVEVNTWVKNETNGLIDELIPHKSLGQDTVLILANALYFKGSWNRKFDISKTQYRTFHLLSGETLQAPFLTSKKYEKHLYTSSPSGIKILKIPYQNNQDTRQFAMYFFLPDKVDGLGNMIRKISSDPEFMNQQFDLSEERLLEFWIPRFNFSYGLEASEMLKNLGLKHPFMGGLTEMVGSDYGKELCIAQIFHKSYIEVNEEGTEAAASTAPRLIKLCARYPVPTFVADHPFMFMIREEGSGIVFFTGAVLNPLLVA